VPQPTAPVIYNGKIYSKKALECRNVGLLYSNHQQVSTTHVAIFRAARMWQYSIYKMLGNFGVSVQLLGAIESSAT
jgi:hypothetical protein